MNINTMSDRLEQLEQASNGAACSCSDLSEGWNKTDEVGTAPVVAELAWSESSPYSQRSDTGHQVSAAKGAHGWVYTAWGRDRAPGVQYHAVSEVLGGREHYGRGEHAPERFPCLGHFPTAEQARAACAADAAKGAHQVETEASR